LFEGSHMGGRVEAETEGEFIKGPSIHIGNLQKGANGPPLSKRERAPYTVNNTIRLGGCVSLKAVMH